MELDARRFLDDEDGGGSLFSLFREEDESVVGVSIVPGFSVIATLLS